MEFMGPDGSLMSTGAAAYIVSKGALFVSY